MKLDALQDQQHFEGSMAGSYCLAGAVRIAAMITMLLVTQLHAVAGQKINDNCVEIPFSQRHGLITVQARLGAAPTGTYLVDSGASLSIVDNRHVTHLKSNGGTLTAGTRNGDVTVNTYHPVGLLLKGVPFSTAWQVSAADLKPLKMAFGENYDGLIGSQFFTDCAVQINHDTSTLNVGDIESLDVSHAESLPLRSNKYGNCYVDLIIGELPVPFQLDTGSNGSLMLKARLFDRLVERGMISDLRLHRSLTFAGVVHSKSGRLSQLVIEGQSLSVVKVSRGNANLLGNRLLSRYRVTFDAPNSKLYLEPSAKFSAPETFDRGGLRIACQADQNQVQRVDPNSPADLSGMAVGDIITGIDGVPVKGVNVCRLREKLKGPPDDNVRVTELTIERNGQSLAKTLELRDFRYWPRPAKGPTVDSTPATDEEWWNNVSPAVAE